jgi:hypothetical protein
VNKIQHTSLRLHPGLQRHVRHVDWLPHQVTSSADLSVLPAVFFPKEEFGSIKSALRFDEDNGEIARVFSLLPKPPLKDGAVQRISEAGSKHPLPQGRRVVDSVTTSSRF